MDSQLWVSIIIAVIYLVVRVLKKSENQPKGAGDSKPEREVRYDQTPPTEKPKQLSFEDLLREITEAKQPKKPVYEPVQPKAEYVDYDDDVRAEEQDLEDVNYNYREKVRQNKEYEDAKRLAFERPSLEETMNVRDTNMQFGKFKVFEQEQKKNLLEKYTKDFQDPEGFKRAVVMSEILNRKF